MPDPIDLGPDENTQDAGGVVDLGADHESGWGNVAAMGLGLGAAGLGLYGASKIPGLKGVADTVNDVRRAAMLTGWAPLKSLLGNVGGTAYTSIERGSMEPLKELFSSQTIQDAVDAFKQGAQYGGQAPSTVSKMNLPGRFMGALDKASQGALVRAGLSPEEAATAMLQAPLPPGVSKPLMDNPIMDYLVPFRRTGINQFLEGANTMKPANLATAGQKAALGLAVGSGALEGSSDMNPAEIALTTAASGRYGLPHALAAGAARVLESGKQREGGQLLKGLNPVDLGDSMYGPVADPTKLIPTPKAWTWLKSLMGYGE